MTDIVERLRTVPIADWDSPICKEAADEIVRLRALTAAAEVGPSTSLLSTAIENVKAETIERCAQVADQYSQWTAREIAAAIRALKDKRDFDAAVADD